MVFSMDPNVFKILSCFFILFLGLGGGFLPLKLYGQKLEPLDSASADAGPSTSPSIQSSIVNMFAAGVFLSSALLHFLPDAANNEQLSNFMTGKTQSVDGDDDEEDEYPWANLFFAIGFIFLLSFESMAHEFNTTVTCTDTSMFNQESQRVVSVEDVSEREDSSLGTSLLPGKDDEYDSMETAKLSITNEYSNDDLINQDSDLSQGSDNSGISHGSDDEHESLTRNENAQTTGSTQVMPLVIFLSLSVHSFMAGIGVGSQSGCAWDAFFAILMHKSLVAFSLGVDLTNRHVTTETYVLFLTLFSFMTPVGILFGWLLTSLFTNGEDSVLSGICTAIAGGTFLFICTMEVLPQELKNHKNVAVKLIAMSLGFALIAYTTKYV